MVGSEDHTCSESAGAGGSLFLSLRLSMVQTFGKLRSRVFFGGQSPIQVHTLLDLAFLSSLSTPFLQVTMYLFLCLYLWMSLYINIG